MSAANFTQASTTNIIPFGSGKSYVVRDLLIENDVEHRFTDKLGRTEKDRQFLVQFETIFLAAATGDLSKCQTVIDEGFRDFKAVSFGKFQTDSGEKLDDVSPLNIAVRKKHNKIVALFRETQRKMAQFSPANLQGEKSELGFQDSIYAQQLQRDLDAFFTTSMSVFSIRQSHRIQYECLETTHGAPLLYYNVSVTANGRCFEAFLQDNTIRITNLDTEERIKTSEAHQKQIKSLHVQGDYFFSASEDTTLKSWDAKTGNCVKTFVGHTAEVWCLCVQSNLLFSGSRDGSIKIWDIESGECLNTLNGHSNTVCTIAVRDKFLVSGSWDKTIKIWDITTGKCLKTLTEHTDWVTALLIRDGLIFSGSDDRTIKIWEMQTFKCLDTLKGHKYGILELRMEGEVLISKTREKAEVKLWGLKKADTLED